MRIYVGNLSYDTRDDDLRAAFEVHGSVADATVVMDRMTDRSRGFGFVEMTDSTEAQAAIKALDGTELQGRELRVNEARPRNEGSRGGYR